MSHCIHVKCKVTAKNETDSTQRSMEKDCLTLKADIASAKYPGG